MEKLKPRQKPQAAIWYSLALCGKSPCPRVGQNSLYLPPLEPGSKNGKVIIIAGANPSGSFSDSYFIDLDANCWTTPGWVNLLPRYEHAAFVPTSRPNTVWVFGGASETGNRDCIQVLDLETGSWEKTKVIGRPPSPRTFHTSTAAIGDRFYVFGGGDKGADPVQDQQLHILDSRELKWEKLSTSGSIPGGRAAHSAVAFQGHIYIFGGMDPTGELNTMYRYHIGKSQWTQLEFTAPLPSGRLDHSMCVIPWQTSGEDPHHNRKGTREGAQQGDGGPKRGQPEEGLVHLCLVFGGMNMKGDIYHDCIVSVLQE
ncbi:rab9 effector protein with kelch motifs isoform X2 [Ahaetulla prasina]|uniref:rab9 effector protein with kelch motifs isoform X2 n=1 Tax=Ahaetulla prasina TaxID=499056 RepID=UPI002648342B|nr:rab9 effector protein with kelch motifs isoform X2 [Ahaetulla prasina]